MARYIDADKFMREMCRSEVKNLSEIKLSDIKNVVDSQPIFGMAWRTDRNFPEGEAVIFFYIGDMTSDSGTVENGNVYCLGDCVTDRIRCWCTFSELINF